MPTLKPNGRRLNGKGGGWIQPVRRLAIYLRDRFTCAYCGTDLSTADPRQLTLDHLRPQSRGGNHDTSNLVTACLSCNSRRQHRSWRGYAPEGAIVRILRLRRRKLNLALAKAIRSGAITKEQVLAEAPHA